MIAQMVCNNCHTEVPLRGYVVKEDLKYTALRHLLDTTIKTDDDFDNWLDEKRQEGSVTETVDNDSVLVVDGVEIFDEFQRWENNDCACPECGTKHCTWY